MTGRAVGIIAFALGILLAPFPADAQRLGRVVRIGLLANVPPTTEPHLWNAFMETLNKGGFEEGRNLVIEARYSGGNPARFPDLAAELVRLKVDVLVAGGGGAGVRAAKEATATIPIVMIGASDPVGSGLIASLARPGGNVTGLADLAVDVTPKRLELLKEVVPRATRVAHVHSVFLGAPGTQLGEGQESAARALGITLLRHRVLSPDEIENALAVAARDRPDALLLAPNPINFIRRKQIAGFALQNRLPTIFGYREAVEAGGLMSYGVSLREQFRRVAWYVDKILKGRQARRSSRRAADEVRARDQSQDRQGPRPDDSAIRPDPGGRGDPVGVLTV